MITQFVRDFAGSFEGLTGSKSSIYTRFLAARDAGQDVGSDLIGEIARSIDGDWVALQKSDQERDLEQMIQSMTAYNRFVEAFEREFPGTKIIKVFDGKELGGCMEFVNHLEAIDFYNVPTQSNGGII